MDIGKLRELRKARGMTLEELAAASGTSRQNVHRYEKGVVTNVPPERVLAMARALGVSPDVLMGWDGGESRPEGAGAPAEVRNAEDFVSLRQSNIPLLGDIACGEPILASEEHERFVEAGGAGRVDYCLRAHGNSMSGARIHDGDLVFIRRQESVDNGEIAAVIINDEATLKRVYYYPDEEKLILLPENPRFAPLVYVGEELAHVRILGKAVAFQSLIV